MNLLPYVEHLQSQLLSAAEAGGDEARALAQRLLAPMDSAVRLVLLDALSTAANEITGELAPGSVDVRLRGTEPEFVVTPGATEQSASASAPAAPAAPTVADDSDEGAVSRTTLRLPEQLKNRVELAAGREGLSVNTWLVRAVSASLEGEGARRPARPATTEQNYTGWARS